VIRIVHGTGHGPTSSASFDAALAAANVHQYNLRQLSSVIPAGPVVEVVGRAPDLGPTGNALDVAMARRTVGPGTETDAVAGVGWARVGTTGPGVFSELEGEGRERVRDRLEAAVEQGCTLRDIEVGTDGIGTVLARAESEPEAYATAVVLAAYGESEPLF
jgi:arginine decarboxylase